jgi:hypothetical protein
VVSVNSYECKGECYCLWCYLSKAVVEVQAMESIIVGLGLNQILLLKHINFTNLITSCWISFIPEAYSRGLLK